MSDIVNPYIAGNPVTGTEMFFGREDIFDFVCHTLTGRHRDNVIVLYGQRRTGKTSVLYQMRSHLSEHYLPIFTDLHGFALKGIDGFLWELANHIKRILRRDYKIDLPSLNQDEFIADPRNFFENVFLNNILTAIGDQHILLMLDEAVRLEEQVQAGKLEHEIFGYMRHLMQHYEWLNFLFSLGSGLEEMEKEYAFLFNVGLYKKISFLDQDSAIALITQPVKDCYQVEPAAIERIMQITTGHPYYTQLLCHSLFNRWLHNRSASIEAKEVDEILDEVIERGLAVLKHVWDESTPGEKAVLAGIAAAMDSSNYPVGVEDINRAWSRHNVTIPKEEMVKALRSLTARDLITGQDKYVFTVDLQRLWLQKYKRLDWVEEEIINTIHSWSLNAPAVRQTAALFRVPSKLGAIGVRPLLLIGLALVLIVGGFETLYIARNNSIDATIAQARVHTTAAAQTQATAQANATATAVVTSHFPSFTTLALNDTLQANSNFQWGWATGGGCQFSSSGYQAGLAQQGYFQTCFAENTSFADFAYQVEMIIQKGDCGGLAFRGATIKNSLVYYVFQICQDGTYSLFVQRNNSNSSLLSSNTTNIKQGLNQQNVIAVAVQGFSISMYVNDMNTPIQTLTDNSNTSSKGAIGVMAASNSPTTATFTNALVWVQP